MKIDVYTPPWTYLLRAFVLFIIAAPTIALGWTWFPEAQTNVIVALGVSFIPIIPAYYFAAKIHRWYVGDVNYKGLIVFHMISEQVVPTFREGVQQAVKKVTEEYVHRFANDPKFRATEIMLAVLDKEEEEEEEA